MTTEKSAIAFDFGEANDAQREAISSTEGPVLITAGPGTGKTFTLIQRIVYLIDQKNVNLDEIFVATFTDKAAKELITRITNELADRGMSLNVSEMYVGTFHSLCLRILDEYRDRTRLKQGYRVLDAFDQVYLIFQNFELFAKIDNFDVVVTALGKWRGSEEIARLVNMLNEELISLSVLEADNAIESRVAASIARAYSELVDRGNLLDFSAIQVEAYRLLNSSPLVLADYTSKIRYLMIDEYQDTNYVQEQIVFLLGGEKRNICVVGDDDQGLYRFRGATIRNILEFPARFPDNNCKIVSLVENYRSHPQIVDFYNTWMETTEGRNFSFSWDRYRYDKRIVPATVQETSSPAVVRIAGKVEAENWHRQVLNFINRLRGGGRLSDLNQIAFLFHSVKSSHVRALAQFLEDNGVPVHSPRSAMFFERFEIRLALGCLLLMFPNLVGDFEENRYLWMKDSFVQYLSACLEEANEYLTDPGNGELFDFVRYHARSHLTLQDATDYSFLGLLYRMLAVPPFANMLGTDLSEGSTNLRPVRNLAQLTRIVGKFEYLHGINLLSGSRNSAGVRYIDANADKLFITYLRLLFEEGVVEHEGESEYAPSGSVLFSTIHQSKGMEFPIVIVDSLKSVPRKRSVNACDSVIERHLNRAPFEPNEQIKFFDFWRLYYTAFSRAKNLLALSCLEDRSTPSRFFDGLYRPLADWDADEVDLEEYTFEPIRESIARKSFSLTSHIAVYETCARQYKFFNELEFQPARVSAKLFGRVVQQTIDNIHRTAIRGEVATITRANACAWFDENYTHLARSEKVHLAEPAKKAALEHVLRYVDRQHGRWDTIRDAKVDLSLIRPRYVLDGDIDLIRDDGGAIEIVSFSATPKPDPVAESGILERHRRQLNAHAHIVEKNSDEKVSWMHLYYTGETDDACVMSWQYNRADDDTVQVLDNLVTSILDKRFDTTASSSKTCEACDFRSYCGSSRHPTAS